MSRPPGSSRSHIEIQVLISVNLTASGATVFPVANVQRAPSDAFSRPNVLLASLEALLLAMFSVPLPTEESEKTRGPSFLDRSPQHHTDCSNPAPPSSFKLQVLYEVLAGLIDPHSSRATSALFHIGLQLQPTRFQRALPSLVTDKLLDVL